MNKILFVCTGNTCRSCMAEGLLKKYAEEFEEDKKIQISSAGTYVFMPTKASPNAIAAMRAQGIDISAHESRQVTAAMINEAAYILAMTNVHKQILQKMCPQSKQRIYTLKEFANNETDSDISDPFGLSLEDYIECAKQIEDCVKKIVPILREQ